MKLEIYPDSINYTAQIVKIKTIRKHSNADRLMCTAIQGNNVICDLETKIDDLYIYFPLESQLSVQFSNLNDLIRRKNEDGTPVGGMFAESRRVKAIKLRGEKSEGFIIPINSLEKLGIDYKSLKEGDEFNSINGVSICQKYIIPRQNSGYNTQKTKSVRISRLVPNQVRLHIDTLQLQKNLNKISPEDMISIHYKKHGSSWWCGNLLVNRKLSIIDKIAKFFGIKIQLTEYDTIYGSRKVVKNEFETRNASHYYKYDIWKDIKEKIQEFIPQGVTLYGEIIGFTKDGGYIQKDYDYGCNPKESKIYVYRITFTNSEGKVFEYTDKQIQEFCEKNGLLFRDTFMYYGLAKDLFPELSLKNTDEWRESFIQRLKEVYTEKDCYMCENKVPEEGIVIRKESLYEYEAYKLKSFNFLLKETKELDSGIVDIETNQDEN